MADHAGLRDAAWDAMKALPRPVSDESALAAAMGVLRPADPRAAEQFRSWWGKHGSEVLKGLNGG